MALLAQLTSDPIYLHGGILPFAEIYKQKGVSLIPFLPIFENQKASFSGELILAPPLAKGSPWLKRFYPYKSAFASGWMQVRGACKQKNVDQGFALSDHADWPDLLRTIRETEACKVLTTYGNTDVLARYLNEIGIDAGSLTGMEMLEEES